MAQGYSTPGNVALFGGDLQLRHDSQSLRGERFVQLPEINVSRAPASLA